MKMNREEFRTFRGYALADRQERNLTPSMEDYLEMIARLGQADGYTRVRDLAQALNVKPPSVSSMIQRLHERGLIRYEKYGVIALTPAGEKTGRWLLERHAMLESFFRALGLNRDILENVERIEHNLTSEATECLSLLVEYVEANPEWFRPFQEFRRKNTSAR